MPYQCKNKDCAQVFTHTAKRISTTHNVQDYHKNQSDATKQANASMPYDCTYEVYVCPFCGCNNYTDTIVEKTRKIQCIGHEEVEHKDVNSWLAKNYEIINTFSKNVIMEKFADKLYLIELIVHRYNAEIYRPNNAKSHLLALEWRGMLLDIIAILTNQPQPFEKQTEEQQREHIFVINELTTEWAKTDPDYGAADSPVPTVVENATVKVVKDKPRSCQQCTHFPCEHWTKTSADECTAYLSSGSSINKSLWRPNL